MADCFTGALCVLGTLIGSAAYALGRWIRLRRGSARSHHTHHPHPETEPDRDRAGSTAHT